MPLGVERLRKGCYLNPVPTATALSGPASVRPGWFALRRRAIKVLGELTKRPESDPCKPDTDSFSIGRISTGGSWRREVRSLDTCEEALSGVERDSLSRQLLPLLQDPDPYIRADGAETLGLIGSPISITFLKPLSADLHNDGKICRSDDKSKSTCQPFYPTREAAHDAVTRIRRFGKRK